MNIAGRRLAVAGASLLVLVGCSGGESKSSPLRDAVMTGSIDEARRLLDDGADPNVESHSTTALTLAAARADVDMVALLIDHGGDARWVSHSSYSLLEVLAVERDPIDIEPDETFVEVARLLVEAGADPCRLSEYPATKGKLTSQIASDNDRPVVAAGLKALESDC